MFGWLPDYPDSRDFTKETSEITAILKSGKTPFGEIAARDSRPIAEIAKTLRKTRGMLYQHLKELKELGYVDGKFEVTLAGKLALI